MRRFKTLLASVLTLAMLASCVLPVSALGIFDSVVIEFPQDKQQYSFEAEDERVTVNNKRFYEKERPEDASGGIVLEGMGGWTTATPPVEQGGDVSFTINVPEDGVYTFWLRNDPMADGESSLWQRIDDDGYKQYWPRGSKNTLQWYLFNLRYLTKGEHTVDIIPRDTGVNYDRFLVSRTVGFSPNGLDGFGELDTIKAGEYFNAPPVVPPANVHPRLMFTNKDIPKIKHGIENIEANKIVYDKLVKLAKQEEEIDGKLDPLASETYNGNTTWEGIITACAFMYALDPENNYHYGRRAYELYMNYTSTYICTTAYAYHTRNYGDIMRVGSEVYDWCYHILTPEERENLYKTMMAYVVQLEIGWPPISQSSFNSHAVESQLPIDLMSFATAVYDEHPDVWDAVAGRLYQEIIPAQNFTYRGGAMSEGTDYTLARVCNIYYCMHMLKAMGYTDQFDDESLEQVMYTWIMKKRPDDGLLSNGDCWNLTPGVYSVDFVSFLHYTYYKNPYTKHLHSMSGNGSGTYTSAGGNNPVTPSLFLTLNTEEVEEKTWDDLPLAYHYGDDEGTGTEAGLLIRSDWNQTNAFGDYGYNIGLNFATHMIGGHQHLDSGAFQITYGNGLALDTGVYNSSSYIGNDGQTVNGGLGWGGYTHHNYTTLTIAHNAMLIRGDDTKRVVGQSSNSWAGSSTAYVDDGGQIGDSAAWMGRRDFQSKGMEDETFHWDAKQTQVTLTSRLAQTTKMMGWDAYPDLKAPDYAYISGDLTYSYPAPRVSDYFRSFVYLNLNEEGEDRDEAALLVYDNMEAATQGLDKVWLLHTQEEPTIEGNRVTLQRTERSYSAKMINDTLLPKEPTYEIIGGTGREFEVNGVNMPRESTKALHEAGKWRVEIGNKYNQIQDDFMNVIQIGKKDSPVYETELVQNDDNFVGTKIKNRVVMMSKSKTKYKKAVEIGIDEKNEGEFTYIVTGVAKGRWKILKDGKEIATYDVADAHPTLNFKAPAGKYRLEWSYIADEPDRDMTFMGNVVEKNKSIVKTKIGTSYIDFIHPMIEMNGTQWLHVKELIQYIGFEDHEYSFSEDGRTLTLGKYTMEVSDDPNETKALKYIDGELYVPIINMDTEFSSAAYWYPACQGLVVAVQGRISADDQARIYDWNLPGFLMPKKGSQSNVSGSTNIYDAVDKNAGSYMYAGGINDWAKIELKEAASVKRAEIYWHVGNTRKMKFEIFVSPDDENYTSVFKGESDGATKGFETFNLAPNENTKFIKIVGYGNDKGDAFSVNSMRFFSK